MTKTNQLPRSNSSHDVAYSRFFVPGILLTEHNEIPKRFLGKDIFMTTFRVFIEKASFVGRSGARNH